MRWRDFRVVLVVAVLAAPLVAALVAPTTITSRDEARTLAPPPAWPQDANQWRALPAAIDAFLADHFGLRRLMIHAQSVIAHLWLGSGDAQVLVGRQGWLFFRGDHLVEQSTGRLVRTARVEDTAGTIARAQAALAARGTTFVFASPPNSAEVYGDMLPGWAAPTGSPTEYDALVAALRRRGVPVLDLRPVLRDARPTGAIYFRHDTHWTARGGLAAFNAVAAAAGHPDWQRDAAQVLTQPRELTGGDLARLLGVPDDLTGETQYLSLPDVPEQQLQPPPEPTFVVVGKQADGPVVMIVGDSFTQELFPPLVVAHARLLVWTHIQNCDFEWKWVDRYKPDEVWWMPTERAFLCAEGVRPRGMPARAEAAGQ